MKRLLMSVIVCLFAVSIADAATYGGSRSFSSSRSYSSPSRSYSAPRPSMTTPAPKSSPPPVVNKTINNTTVIHRNETVTGGGGGSGMNNMLLGGTIGYLLGSHNNAPATVVQAAPPQVIQQAPAQVQPYQYPQEESSHWFLWLLLLVGAGVIIWLMVKHTK